MPDTSWLHDLVAPKSIAEISYEVKSIATHFPEFIRVYTPFIPIRKLDKSYTPLRPLLKSKRDSSSTSNEDNIERSLRRTKQTIQYYVLCNSFELFATFTIKADRQNIPHSKQKIMNWLKNQRNRHGRFTYLVVPEFHKDGRSLHFHALIRGYKGKLKKASNPKTGKVLKQKGRIVYQFVGYRSGFNNVVKIGKDFESQAKVGSYIRKYITKEMPLVFGQNRYFASHDLKRPRIEENPLWADDKTPYSSHANIYGFFQRYKPSDVGGSL